MPEEGETQTRKAPSSEGGSHRVKVRVGVSEQISQFSCSVDWTGRHGTRNQSV